MRELLEEHPAAVLFDLDGTLYSHSPVRRAMALRIAAHLAAHPLSGRRTVSILKAFRRAQEELRAAAFEGDVAAEQLSLAAQRVGCTVSDARAVVERFMEQAPLDLVARHRRADVIDLIDELSRRCVPLGLVSDYPAHSKLAALGLADRFRVIVCAQDPEVGAFKPNPRGLLVAIEQLGVSAAGAHYVGDRLDVDMPAANAAGMSFVHVGAAPGRPGRARETHVRAAFDHTTTSSGFS